MTSFLKRFPGLRTVLRVLRGRSTQGTRRHLLGKLPKRSVGAEIGVHEGAFSKEILEILAPKELHLIDPWEHRADATYSNAWYGGGAPKGQVTLDERFHAVGRRFAEHIESGRIVLHRGYSSDVVGNFPDNFFDWVYIDGNHLYDYVKLDLELYYPKVKIGGYLTGDDYGLQGWWDNGVQQAVDEFVSQRSGLSLEIFGQQFVIRKK